MLASCNKQEKGIMEIHWLWTNSPIFRSKLIMVTNANWPRLKTNWSKTQIDLQHFYVTCTFFNKVLSRWQKLLSRQKRKKLAPQAWLGSAESESYWGLGLGLLKCIFSILKQKLECLNRTQTLLNFGFLGSFFPKKSRRRVHVK